MNKNVKVAYTNTSTCSVEVSMQSHFHNIYTTYQPHLQAREGSFPDGGYFLPNSLCSTGRKYTFTPGLIIIILTLSRDFMPFTTSSGSHLGTYNSFRSTAGWKLQLCNAQNVPFMVNNLLAIAIGYCNFNQFNFMCNIYNIIMMLIRN